MAKIRFGPIVADSRGSIDGVTYSRNRFGAYARNRVSPVNPRTIFQTQVRETLNALSVFWRTLTEAQRAAWTALGAQIIKTDSLGIAYDLTGLQAFIEINGIRAAIGQALTSDAPALDLIPGIDTFSVTADAGPVAVTLNYTSGNDVAAMQFNVWGTDGVSQGRNFFRRSEYKLFFTFPGATVAPVDLTASYVARLGNPVAGTKISFLLVPLSANRIPGTHVRADAIVTA